MAARRATLPAVASLIIGWLLLMLTGGAAAVLAQQAGGSERTSPGAGLRAINIGIVRHAAGMWAAKIVDGGFDVVTGRTIRWFAYDTDSSLAAALSTGRLDIVLIGSSVAASAIARGLDLKIFYVVGSSADTEGLALGAGIEFKPGDAKSLQGKVIAVPFGSTPHFRLLESLRRWGGNVGSMRIVNLQTQQIVEAWSRSEIDAVAASEPLLAKLAQRGQRVPLAISGEHTGLLVLASASEFVAQHIVFLSRIVDLMARADAADGASRGGVPADNPAVKPIAQLTGLTSEEVAAGIGRYRPPSLAEQASPSWLGGGASAGLVAHMKSALDTWRWAGRLSGNEPDFAGSIALEPVTMALGYQR